LAITRFGLLHGWWRYAGVRDVVDIVKAVMLGSVAFFLIVRYVLHLTAFPRSIYVAESLLSAGLLAGVRLLSRLLAEGVRQDLTSAKRLILIGAGKAALTVIRELNQSSTGYRAIACFDDDPSKRGLKIQGVPVMGTVGELPGFLQQFTSNVEVIIAVPSATSEQMRRFVDIASSIGIPYRTVPGLKDILAGHVLMEQLREVNLDDLLGRVPVDVDVRAVFERIEGQTVMVTGAAGSIGSELCRQICKCFPAELVCVDQNENGIFHLQLELQNSSPATNIRFCVADIRDTERMLSICAKSKPAIIFHAAAYKHVPVMENNIDEAVRNNVFGLMALLNVAEECHARDLVLISSDKAVNPSSIMGATKRICELIVASRPANGLRCTSVRFGNVLGSSGSVVPIFQDQLRHNLPLTITHPDIQRFFMTTSEAVALVLQAFAVGKHGDILVLDMGRPVKIVELATSLMRLAGKSEDQVKIIFTGLRPGEKLSEELLYEDEQIVATSHPKIKRIAGSHIGWSTLLEHLNELEGSLASEDSTNIGMAIRAIVPEWSPEQPGDLREQPRRKEAIAG